MYVCISIFAKLAYRIWVLDLFDNKVVNLPKVHRYFKDENCSNTHLSTVLVWFKVMLYVVRLKFMFHKACQRIKLCI